MSLNEAFGEGTQAAVKRVYSRYSALSTVWLITLHEGGDEQTVYVITPHKDVATATAKVHSTLTNPTTKSAYKRRLHELDPGEFTQFVGRIAVFDIEPEE